MRRTLALAFLLICFLVSVSLLALAPQDDWAARLIGAVMGPSPLEENLRKLTDEIGGRVPGTEANRKGVAWAVA